MEEHHPRGEGRQMTEGQEVGARRRREARCQGIGGLPSNPQLGQHIPVTWKAQKLGPLSWGFGFNWSGLYPRC